MAPRLGDASLLAGATLLWLACWASTVAALSDSERVATLDQVSRGKRDGVLSLNAASFRKYVETSPRSYSLLVLFVADASICKPCAPMRTEFGRAAAEYAKLSTSRQARHPVFFAELKLSLDDRSFLSDYGIEHVPILHRFGPGKSKPYPGVLSSFAGEGLAIEQAGFSLNAIKRFVNSRVRSRLPVVRGDYQIPFASTVRTMMPLIVTAAAAGAALAVFLGWVRRPMFWFGCCVVVYMYSVGGGHYTWINNSPFAVVNADGVPQYVSEGSRNQYVAEGMFVSLTCSAISAIVILINELPHVFSAKNGQTAVGLVLACVVFACITTLLSLYQLKMPSYLQYEA
jgi:hypothetical protein